MSNFIDIIFGLILGSVLAWLILLQSETMELKKELNNHQKQIKIIDERFYVE